jgi:hypothetical protein
MCDSLQAVRFRRSGAALPGCGLAFLPVQATCAGHVQQLGSESLLPNLMEVKG